MRTDVLVCSTKSKSMSTVFKEINLSYLESIADGDRKSKNDCYFLEQIPSLAKHAIRL